MIKHSRIAICEALGTLALVFVGLSSIVLFLGLDLAMLSSLPHWLRLGLVLLGFGAVITLVISSPIGRISGAQINPAVTLGLFLRGELPFGQLLPIVAAQLIGAWLGALLATLTWRDSLSTMGYGVTHHNAAYPLWASIAVEAAGTLLLMWLILWSIAKVTRKRYQACSVGGFIWLFGWATATISGASFNPARSIGPALASGDYSELWLYIVFPLLGAAIAAIWCRLAPRSCGCADGSAC
jgi:aquaporin Z